MCSAPPLLGKQVWSLPGCLLAPASPPLPQGCALTGSPYDETSPHLSPWGTVVAQGSEMTRKENSPKQLWDLESPLGKLDAPDGIPQLPAVYIAVYAAPAKAIAS